MISLKPCNHKNLPSKNNLVGGIDKLTLGLFCLLDSITIFLVGFHIFGTQKDGENSSEINLEQVPSLSKTQVVPC